MLPTASQRALASTIKLRTACKAAGSACAGICVRRCPCRMANFDHVVMLAVLEHLTEPEKVLREAHRILAPGGSLIMTWPSAMVDPILDMLHSAAPDQR